MPITIEGEQKDQEETGCRVFFSVNASVLEELEDRMYSREGRKKKYTGSRLGDGKRLFDL